MIGYDRLERRGKENYLDRAVLSGRGYIRRGLLGTGRFSDVYWVEDAADGEKYACKVSTEAEMLEREAKVLEGLRHPLFPEFRAFWRMEGLGVLIREYVEGSSLDQMLGRRRFSAAQTVRWGMELAAGLGYLHGLPQRFLFRDVKPANVIVGQDGHLKLIDLGCVCSMSEKVSSRAGSPGFAAPEQLRAGGALSESWDVYGLGKTLEAMLGAGNGSRKRAVDSGARGKWARGSGKPERPWEAMQELRERRQLQRLIKACTEEEAQRRVADMGEVLRQLAGIGAVPMGEFRIAAIRILC